jgi:predicted chitinase
VTVALEVATLTKCGVPDAIARHHLPHMEHAMLKYGITTRPRARAFLATVLHESMGLRATTEQASGSRYEGRRDLGNTHPGDGQRFKGRGPIQLTGRANYASYGRRIGVNLEAHPDMVAQPEIGWQVAGMFFQKCLPAADAGDFRRVTKLVNGGLNGWDDRVRYWNKLAGLGVVPGTPDIKRGAKGAKVELLTRRLSYLIYKKTGKPFLDGQRSTFDRSTTRALRRFQKERGLKIDGVFGPRVAAELDQLVRAEKARRHKAASAAPAVAAQPAAAAHQAAAATPQPAAAQTAAAPAVHASAPPQHPAHAGRGARIERLWARLEHLDTVSDRLRAELAAFDPSAPPPPPAEAAPVAAAPVVAPPPGPPAEQLSTHEIIESLKHVDAEEARVLGALEARLASLDQARQQAAAPAAAHADAPVPVGAPAPAPATAAAVPATNGEAVAAPIAPNGSAADMRELVRLEQEADHLRAILEERVLDAEGVNAGAPAPVAVENATMQRFMTLVGQLDAIDAKADRVRQALRLATGHPADAGATSAVAPATPSSNGGGAGATGAAKPAQASGARTFRLQKPLMKGDDIRNWQAQLNKQLKQLKVDFEIGVDGEYGGETARWSKRVLYALGLTSGKWHGVAALRTRDPWLRKLRKSHDAPKGGIRAAVMYARKYADMKVHETRTNGGPFIDDWERAVGIQGQPWCGAFANACLVRGGLPSRSWIRYTPSIVRNAKAGLEGWSWHGTPKIGDLVLFNWPGGDFVDHVGVVIETHPDGSIKTVEGNMSNRVDYWQRKSMILGYARPPWNRGR